MKKLKFINVILNNTILKNTINIEKIVTITGSFFLVLIIFFSIYTVIRKNQQAQLQSTARDFIEKSISSISDNWHYLETQSLFSNSSIRKIGKNNTHIFNKFSRLGKLITHEKPEFLNNNPSPVNNDSSVSVSYKVLATFENGQAIFLFNLANHDETTVINFINIDAIYNINTAIGTAPEETL